MSEIDRERVRKDIDREIIDIKILKITIKKIHTH